ncbi:RNA polymerase sigma factor [Streptomyces melanogenes]|uniref:RNA polymerase sigma factor n=1 Tax=Streptomyces melanogenes TaxID=67326 RepID=UPI00167DB729|nr:sigma-70 family RNA polymerase sigma factor [Streptomyces melanogenes]
MAASLITPEEEFFHSRFRRIVASLMRKHGLIHEDAEDIAKEAYADLSKRWGEMPPERFEAWWFQRSYWRAGDFRRKREPLTLLAEFEERVSSACGPDDLAVRDDQVRQVLKLARDLPPEKRRHLALVAYGFSSAEAAQVLGKSPGAERTARHRLLRDLQQRMGIGSETEDT